MFYAAGQSIARLSVLPVLPAVLFLVAEHLYLVQLRAPDRAVDERATCGHSRAEFSPRPLWGVVTCRESVFPLGYTFKLPS